ncbi:ectoine utilization protein EutA [Marinivivus vitaminiproducens]|uniref:ectoine utilization protein EutA n=1 Tax=Marinivivus vitaminiproducens TaxID=3035935 RepID=UPI002799FF8C|nr:ectoine utilization protein EutA [Geminicoccaceae bacterium SCSIO 64248]
MSGIRTDATALAFDAEPVARRIGLVALATDHTTERDFERLLAPAGIGVYTARLAYANPTTADNLIATQPRLRDAAALILPGERLDAICYSCTSASVVIGDRAVEAAIHEAQPGVPVVTPPLAAAAGLRALGARRISLLTPYTEAVTAPMADYFRAKGFELAGVTCFGLDDDRRMARITPASLAEAAVAAIDEDADALFISCTALRSAAVAARIEARVGRPVVTSNQATAWACLRLCNHRAPMPDHGRLMSVERYAP